MGGRVPPPPRREGRGRLRAGAALAAALVLLSGCVSGHTAVVTVDQQGGAADAGASTSCQDTAFLGLSVSVRAGSIHLRVLDGSGAVAFNETYEAPDGGETQRSLFGAPGDWSVEATSPSFDGRLHAELSCA